MPYDMAGATSSPPADDGEARPKKSVTTQLVEMAERNYRILLAEDGAPFAVEDGGPNLAIPLRGRDSLRQRLARLYFEETGNAAAGAALADALAVLEGGAIREAREPVALRLARDDGAVVLDLGRPDGRVAVVQPGRWRVADRSPVLFRRTALTGEMPLPVRGGDAEELLGDLVNAGVAAVRLIVAWLVAALIPDMPHPILGVFGEQGTAKTSLMRTLAMLVDPSPAPTRTAPRDLGQWAVTASASWVVALDNVSTIPDWLSDALCRAVTGDGLTSRALYTDGDVSVLSFRRVLAMTSIDAGALRGDLGERLLPIELDVIAAQDRRPDAEMAARFTDAAPHLLGAVLDLLAAALLELPRQHPTELPRMADFARLLHAIDAATGWSTVDDYADTAADVAETVIDSDPFAVAVRDLVRVSGGWSGTASELLEKVTPERPVKGWPRSPRAISGAIKRITPALRQVGITVEHGKSSDRARTRILTLAGPGPYPNRELPSEPSEPSAHLFDQQEPSDGWNGQPSAQPSAPDRAAHGADGSQVATGQPSAQPSAARTPSDQGRRRPSDGSDGSDGRAGASSRPVGIWIGSGEPA